MCPGSVHQRGGFSTTGGGCPGSVNQEEGAAPGWPIDVPLALHGCMGARLLGSFVGDYKMGSKDRCQND